MTASRCFYQTRNAYRATVPVSVVSCAWSTGCPVQRRRTSTLQPDCLLWPALAPQLLIASLVLSVHCFEFFVKHPTLAETST